MCSADHEAGTGAVAAAAHAASPAGAVTLGGLRCPVCAAPAGRAADLGDFDLYRCDACGCWSSDALVRNARTSFDPVSYFDRAAVDRPKWEELMRQLQGRATAIASALDVGCGTGPFLAFLHERFPEARLEGVELDEQRAAVARRNNPGAQIHGGDAVTVLARRNAEYDLITLWDVLEHVPEPARLLGELARKLSPGGLVFIQTIHENSLVPWLGRASYALSGGRLRGPLRRTHDAHHLVFFSRNGLRLMADSAGLSLSAQWFDRLALARMDAHPLVKLPTSLLLAAENACGNGLFINLLMEKRPLR